MLLKSMLLRSRLIKFRIIGVSFVVVTAVCVSGAVAVFDRVPLSNTSATHFDVIIVLGCPANDAGKPTPDQRERVMEGVREYRRGVAPYIIMTGGAAHNRFVEARVMGEFARSVGVPAGAITEEPQAQNTVQNAYYSVEILQKHHWRSAEVVSSVAHIRRAALIMQRFSREGSLAAWRVHAAPWPPESSVLRLSAMYAAEFVKVAMIHTFGFRRSPFVPERRPETPAIARNLYPQRWRIVPRSASFALNTKKSCILIAWLRSASFF